MERITCADLMGYLEKEPEKVMVLDIETTGLHAPEDEVLSLAIIDGTGETLFYDSFKPEHNTAWPEAQAVNGISPDDVADGSIFTEETEYINLLLAKAAVIVGYNHEGFDLPFLAQFGVCPPEDVKLADVMVDYAEIKGEWDKNHQDWKWQKLVDCAAHYGYHYHAHDSLGDAGATLFCARKCAEEQLQKRAAYRLLESGKTLFIQACDGGYDYTIFDVDDKAVDGGRLDNEKYSLLDARNELLVEMGPMESVLAYTGEALDDFLARAAENEQEKGSMLSAETKKAIDRKIDELGEYGCRKFLELVDPVILWAKDYKRAVRSELSAEKWPELTEYFLTWECVEESSSMQVLIVRPGEYAERVKIDGSLKSMQDIVGGLIEVVYLWEERAVIVCNDEALLLNMKPNRFVAEIQEPIFGSFFVCGLGDGDLVGLTDEQLERFEKKFHYPQLFTMAENCCIVTDCRPEDLTQPKEPLSP